MFTGLVQTTGTVRSVEARGSETRLCIGFPSSALPDLELGESIAVNGTCLTVETFGKDWYTAYASAETLSHTNLGTLRPGSLVNLERALALGDRLGGHLVSGHVDCTARVQSISPAGLSRIYRLSFPAEHGRYVIEKGSVALDGISLTVNACGPDWLEVNIIPETQRATTISGWKPGYGVNMETDLIGKYVRRMVAPWTGDDAQSTEDSSGITEAFLRMNGF
ncbi:riboflavin synthase [Desulfobaculum xiamenense]|uniref:Riboflavin synthase n=1 Tax=Desulfobaculum xiamenense TaxID=995050 RepID=A0A846QRK0_9BACT|nr:riboflavin synthase [Desulfobaculum xiamenense]NJB68993.1 riboflavin synthase [Desulfobaculum xiamenense]